MLAYILALTVGLGSLVIYMAAFFFPEVHRKGDFIWSGVGLFYALILWVCSARITGAVLLGQIAGVALLGWSVSQTLTLRRQVTPRGAQQTELPSTEEVKNTVKEKVANSSFFGRLSPFTKRGGSASEAKNRLQENLSSAASTTATDTAVKIIDNSTPLPQPVSSPVPADTASVSEREPDIAAPVADEVVQSPIGATDDGESIATGEQETSVTEDSAIASVVESTTDLPAATEDSAIASVVESTTDLPPATEDSAIASVVDNPTEELVRPHAPDPELVEAAIKDAEEKHQPASPPDPDLENHPN